MNKRHSITLIKSSESNLVFIFKTKFEKQTEIKTKINIKKRAAEN